MLARLCICYSVWMCVRLSDCLPLEQHSGPYRRDLHRLTISEGTAQGNGLAVKELLRTEKERKFSRKLWLWFESTSMLYSFQTTHEGGDSCLLQDYPANFQRHFDSWWKEETWNELEALQNQAGQSEGAVVYSSLSLLSHSLTHIYTCTRSYLSFYYYFFSLSCTHSPSTPPLSIYLSDSFSFFVFLPLTFAHRHMNMCLHTISIHTNKFCSINESNSYLFTLFWNVVQLVFPVKAIT